MRKVHEKILRVCFPKALGDFGPQSLLISLNSQFFIKQHREVKHTTFLHSFILWGQIYMKIFTHLRKKGFQSLLRPQLDEVGDIWATLSSVLLLRTSQQSAMSDGTQHTTTPSISSVSSSSKSSTWIPSQSSRSPSDLWQTCLAGQVKLEVQSVTVCQGDSTHMCGRLEAGQGFGWHSTPEEVMLSSSPLSQKPLENPCQHLPCPPALPACLPKPCSQSQCGCWPSSKYSRWRRLPQTLTSV